MEILAASIRHDPATLSRRGRPTLKRAAHIDNSIVRVALKQFLAAGYDGTNMDSVAAAAGVSKGTLYSRYASKDALFRTALEYQLDQTSKRASRRNHLAPQVLDKRLMHHAETMIDAAGWAEYQRMARLLETASLSQPDLMHLWQNKVSGEFRAVLIDAMKETADIAPNMAVDWAFLADLFLLTLGGWLTEETRKRTIPKNEAMDYAKRVVSAVEATLHAMTMRTA